MIEWLKTPIRPSQRVIKLTNSRGIYLQIGRRNYLLVFNGFAHERCDGDRHILNVFGYSLSSNQDNFIYILSVSWFFFLHLEQ